MSDLDNSADTLTFMAEDSRIVAKTDTCPKCECYCLHDVLNLPTGPVMQCKNGMCQFQWIEGHPAEVKVECRCGGRGTYPIACPDGRSGCLVAHYKVCEAEDCLAKSCSTCGGKGWVVEGQTIEWPYGEQVQCPRGCQ